MTMEQLYLVELLARADQFILDAYPPGSDLSASLWGRWTAFMRYYHEDPHGEDCYEAALSVMDLVRATLH